MSGAKEDPGLAGVKAVLEKLQRIDFPGTEAPPSGTLTGEDSAHAHSGIVVFDRKRAVLTGLQSPPRPRRRIGLYLGLACAVIALAGLYLTAIADAPWIGELFSGASPVANKEEAAKLLTNARRLLGEGDVKLARGQLLHGAPERNADLALLLAQSYDPNYVRTLPRANALPDRAEAERWYRAWYDLAVKSGLEMDNARLQRIINAMP
jgi:hypothetical protein